MKSIFFILLALGMTEPINANLVKIKTVHPVPVNPEPAKLNPVKLDPFLKPPSSLKIFLRALKNSKNLKNYSARAI